MAAALVPAPMRSFVILALTVARTVAAAAPASPAAAASSPASEVPTFTLPQALAHARTHQPQIKSALAELRARDAESRIPRAQWYPQIGATAQLFGLTTNQTTATYIGARGVDLPRVGATKPTGAANWSPSVSTLAAITLDQEIYDFGRIAAQSAVADAWVEYARANAQATALDVQLSVEEAYHGVLAAREVDRATDDAYRRAVAHRDYARASTRSGLKPAIELTRAEAGVAQLDVRRIRAGMAIHVARAALAATMGGQWLEVDAAPVALAGQRSPSLAEAVRAALQHNPAVLAALARVNAMDSVASAILHELMPNLYASLGISGRAGGATPTSGAADVPYGDGWLPDVANWHAGLVLQWSIFDMTVLRRRSAAQARGDVARADLDVARTAVTLAAQRSFLALDASLRILPSLESAVAAARANQNQAEVRFQAGLGNTLEVADAEALLTQAELELAIGRFNAARARAALGRALGESQEKP